VQQQQVARALPRKSFEQLKRLLLQFPHCGTTSINPSGSVKAKTFHLLGHDWHLKT
jgi:hypothetical protein